MVGSRGLAQSVNVRLARHAKALGADPNLVLTRYALERFLYRLSRSPHADRFVLKGAVLLLAWFGETFRPTRDVDMLGYGDLSDEALAATFREVCGVEVEPDGMIYLPGTLQTQTIRPEDEYGGRRVTIDARCGSARARVQIDVGIGDAVTPAPERLEYPTLLDFPPPVLLSYTRETVIAEKVHALVLLGVRNSRMKDSSICAHCWGKQPTREPRSASQPLSWPLSPDGGRNCRQRHPQGSRTSSPPTRRSRHSGGRSWGGTDWRHPPYPRSSPRSGSSSRCRCVWRTSGAPGHERLSPDVLAR